MVENQISSRKMILLMVCGILGCIFMGGSDWLMIYGNTAYEGSLAWLTAGAAEIPSWRNNLAMALAFPAVMFYSAALFGAACFLREKESRKTYSALTAVGLTPWLSLHLFYVMILYLFAWLENNGYADAAHPVCEALFSHFAWLIPAAEVIMVLPFIYLFYVIVAGRSIFPRRMAVSNPLIIYIVLKAVTMVLPDTPFRLAFTNGLMSESMAVWFLVFLIFIFRTVHKARS